VCKSIVSVVVWEGAIARDCRGIGRICLTCKVDIIDHSVSGECGEGWDIGGKRERKVRRREERKEDRRRKKLWERKESETREG
jgi:hypothetical protein